MTRWVARRAHVANATRPQLVAIYAYARSHNKNTQKKHSDKWTDMILQSGSTRCGHCMPTSRQSDASALLHVRPRAGESSFCPRFLTKRGVLRGCVEETLCVTCVVVKRIRRLTVHKHAQTYSMILSNRHSAFYVATLLRSVHAAGVTSNVAFARM